jgi:hypothetical protein
MSDAPYRGAATREIAPLVVRYCPFEWYVPFVLALVAGVVGWAVQGDTGPSFVKHAGCGALFVLLIAVVRIPVVTVRAEVTAGQLVVRGYRWPGPELVWSAGLPEIRGFEVQLVEDAKRRTYRRLALRTEDERILPLTETAWPGGSWLYPRLVARLDAWLAAAR